MNLRRLGVFLNLLLILVGNKLIADDHSNARGKGMGNSNVVSSFGIGAFGVNPANFDNHLTTDINTKTLKFGKDKDKPTWEISVFSGGGSYGSDESLGFYNNYLKYLSNSRLSKSLLLKVLSKIINKQGLNFFVLSLGNEHTQPKKQKR